MFFAPPAKPAAWAAGSPGSRARLQGDDMKITSVLTGMIVWAWSWLGRLERPPSVKKAGHKERLPWTAKEDHVSVGVADLETTQPVVGVHEGHAERRTQAGKLRG